MKEQLKLTLKNAEIKQEDGNILVYERNNKDELIGRKELNEIIEKIQNKENLKISIGTGNTMDSESVVTILNQFIGKDSLNITIESNEES